VIGAPANKYLQMVVQKPAEYVQVRYSQSDNTANKYEAGSAI